MKGIIKVFDPSLKKNKTAAELFESAADLPLICPHTHVDPGLFANPEAGFAHPASLFVTPDHYVVRMLISQGIRFEQLGIFPVNEKECTGDPREIWQLFCEHFSLFDGTPSGLWIRNALSMVFDISDKPNGENADDLYDRIISALQEPDFSPRHLFERFNIEVLCTTDSARDSLEAHDRIKASGWTGQIRPTFRPDALIQIGRPGWIDDMDKLSQVSGVSIAHFSDYLEALSLRREVFKAKGAVAIDLGVETPYTCQLSAEEAEVLFQKGLRGKLSHDEARQFGGLMIYEMARMSLEDGLVMQLHAGSYRNHHSYIYETYGPDHGFDIPVQVEWTRNLKPLLDSFGMDQRLRLILFTLDESGYSRELAPLAGSYPAIRLGPPWWFHDSPEGMLRYFDAVVETAGFNNLVGFNDDTRAFLSIPARHDLWRQMSALWLAKLVRRGQISMNTARMRMVDLAYNLAKQGYRL